MHEVIEQSLVIVALLALTLKVATSGKMEKNAMFTFKFSSVALILERMDIRISILFLVTLMIIFIFKENHKKVKQRKWNVVSLVFLLIGFLWLIPLLRYQGSNIFIISSSNNSSLMIKDFVQGDFGYFSIGIILIVTCLNSAKGERRL